MITPRFTFLLFVLLTHSATADILVLTDGTHLNGTYAGGSRTSIRFETDGKIRSIAIDDIVSLTFDRQKEIETPARPSARRPDRPTVETPSLKPVRTGLPTLTIPKDTAFPVSLTRELHTQKNKKNDRVTATLTRSIRSGARMLLTRNTQLHGRIIRTQSITKGKSILEIELTTLQINNHLQTLTTNHIGLECDGNLITVTSGESAFAPDLPLGDFITEAGEIHIPENTELTFHLTSPLSLPEK